MKNRKPLRLQPRRTCGFLFLPNLPPVSPQQKNNLLLLSHLARTFMPGQESTPPRSLTTHYPLPPISPTSPSTPTPPPPPPPPPSPSSPPPHWKKVDRSRSRGRLYRHFKIPAPLPPPPTPKKYATPPSSPTSPTLSNLKKQLGALEVSSPQNRVQIWVQDQQRLQQDGGWHHSPPKQPPPFPWNPLWNNLLHEGKKQPLTYEARLPDTPK